MSAVCETNKKVLLFLTFTMFYNGKFEKKMFVSHFQKRKVNKIIKFHFI